MEKQKGSAEAIRVHCKIGKVDFSIGWKSVKNNENLCSRCPVRKSCKNRQNYHVRIFDILRSNMNIHTYEVVIL